MAPSIVSIPSTKLFMKKVWAPPKNSAQNDSLCDFQALIYTKIHLVIKASKLKQILNMLGHVDKVWLALWLQLHTGCSCSSPSISISLLEAIITWPLSFHLGNGRSLILTVSSWDRISTSLCFSSHVLLKVTHCSSVYSFYIRTIPSSFWSAKGGEKFNLRWTNTWQANTILHLLFKGHDKFIHLAWESWWNWVWPSLPPVIWCFL